ncbi:hypothetical protein [Halomonas sp. GT]|uniref:hypothetical protein n=1 Tax=Halomonas sp. GT TaxID=1971364 RepID=UPI0009F3FD33|nr:hypothetical protein [Halomonas sp. GT]
MKHLDRGSQRDLLNQLAERYPEPADHFFDQTDLHHPDSVNLHYLEGHGLVELGRSDPFSLRHTYGERKFNGNKPNGSVRITEAGMDFIQDDGGLSAILGTVTVKLHVDTIRDLIESKINNNEDITPDKKSSLINSLRKMPEEVMRQLTQKLIGYGLDQAPSAWGAIIRALEN